MHELEQSQRNELAERLKAIRARDRKSFVEESRPLIDADVYINDRGLDDYLYKLLGLEAFMNFLRGVEGSKKILDIGAGTTRAAAELSKSHLGRELDVRATTLTYNPTIDQNLGRKRTSITPVEALRGIDDQSVAGIIGLNSIAYSRYPHLAVNSIDRVLVPGGAVKATFERLNDDKGMKDERYFWYKFDELGYDVAIASTSFHRVLVAIKLGSTQQISAEQLIKQDRDSELDQHAFVVQELKAKLPTEAT